MLMMINDRIGVGNRGGGVDGDDPDHIDGDDVLTNPPLLYLLSPKLVQWKPSYFKTFAFFLSYIRY